MNVPFKLREPKGLTIPRGPSFQRAQAVCSSIAGTEIQFRVPKHSPRHSNNKEVFPGKRYALDELRFSSRFKEEDVLRGVKDDWEEMLFLYRAWAFNGPWFTGTLGELRLSLWLIRSVNSEQKFSLFHPRAMEMTIGDYLTSLYGHRLNKSRNYIQEYIAPIDWQPLNHLPINTVSLWVKSQDFTPYRRNNRMIFFPVADDMLVLFSFDPSRLKNVPDSEMDNCVSAESMYDLMDQIISSIKVELSPEAKEQQKKALEGLVDTSLVKEFPPIKWDKLDEKTTETILLESKQKSIQKM